MTWVFEQTKENILELAKDDDLYKNGGFAIFNDKLYYINVTKGAVEPVIQHKF